MTKAFVKDTAMLARIALSCTECGDCLEWGGSFQKSNTGVLYPSIRIDGKAKMVRRLVYEAARGPIRAKHSIRTTCRNDKCVYDEHLRMSTTTQIAQIAVKEGKFAALSRGMKIAQSKRTNGNKLTLEQAKEIRTSEESGPALAARYGINRSLASRIKAGKAWKDYSNPFMGLMSR